MNRTETLVSELCLFALANDLDFDGVGFSNRLILDTVERLQQLQNRVNELEALIYSAETISRDSAQSK